MENTLKIKVFGKSILFCKHLRNKRSNLNEIFLLVDYYLVSLSFKFHEDPCTNANHKSWGAVNVINLTVYCTFRPGFEVLLVDQEIFDYGALLEWSSFFCKHVSKIILSLLFFPICFFSCNIFFVTLYSIPRKQFLRRDNS